MGAQPMDEVFILTYGLHQDAIASPERSTNKESVPHWMGDYWRPEAYESLKDLRFHFEVDKQDLMERNPGDGEWEDISYEWREETHVMKVITNRYYVIWVERLTVING